MYRKIDEYVLQKRSHWFLFLAGNLVVTFSGLGQQQIKLNDDNVVQPVDSIILNTGKDKITKPETYRAAGSCRFSNPYSPSTISCRADTEKGLFEGIFISNGQPPDLFPSAGAGALQENEPAAPIVAANGVVLEKMAIANWNISAKKRGNVFDAKRFSSTFRAANQLLDQKLRNCLYQVKIGGDPKAELCNVPDAQTLKYAASLYVAALHMALNPP